MTEYKKKQNKLGFFFGVRDESSIKIPPCAHRFGQAALVHVLVAGAPLPASTRMVHGSRGTGYPVAVVAGVGRVVGSVAAVVVVVVAADEREGH